MMFDLQFQKTMKRFLLIGVILLAFTNCANQLQPSFPVGITEVYFQHWVGGIRGGGSGTNVVVTLKKELPKNCTIKQLYFQQKVANPFHISSTQFQFSFKGNANWDRGNDMPSDVSEKVIKMPFPIEDNQAILEYTYNGKTNFYKITNLVEKEMLAYPSARPQN